MIIGGIMLWSGDLVDLPDNYKVCDGQNGTPDLSEKFVIGASGSYPVGSAGGAMEHSHSFSTNGHVHSIATTHGCPGSGGVTAWSCDADGNDVGTSFDDGDTATEPNIPPYRSMYYVMRLS